MNAYEAGRTAHLAGLDRSQNPHTCGTTKLGAPKLTEEGIEWDAGFVSCIKRIATKEEIAFAASMDVSRFRRKSNRYYR